MIKATYIYHDCFLISTPEADIVFDYWKDPAGAARFLDGRIPGRPLYVFVSHHHKDHFTKEIFLWEQRFPDIRFIISNDTAKAVRYMLREDSVYTGFRPSPSKVTVLRRGESFSDNLLTIEAFGSTDIGNSYLVETAGHRLFHAGDLNAWLWKDESTPQEIKKALGDFNAIVNEVSSATQTLDLAMFPVDSRIGRDYWEGASIFVRKIDVAHFLPMHFCLGETPEERARLKDDASSFELYANPDRGDYIALRERGDCLCF